MLSGPSTNWGRSNGIENRRLGPGGRAGASAAVAQRDLNRIPRPIFGPLDRQSIQPAVIGQSALAALRPAMNASMFGIRSLSCQIQGEGTRIILNAASRMWPVRPM